MIEPPIDPKGSRALSRFLFLALGGGILIVVFLSLWQRNQMIHIGYEIEQLKEEKEALLRVQKELLVEAESLGAMERIEQIAVEQLEMKPSASQQRVHVTDGPLPVSDGGKATARKGNRFGSAQVGLASTGKDVSTD